MDSRHDCDVLVVGTGAGGFAAAITACHAGLNVLMVEKSSFFGGTTAVSGGFLWIPGNPHAKDAGIADSKDAARDYLKHESGNAFNAECVEAFLDRGPEMLDFFESKTEVHFTLSPDFPDYHAEAPGGLAGGRSIYATPYDGLKLGRELGRLRPPLRTITFIGMMFNASTEVKHFFNATRSLKSAWYVAKRLSSHFGDLARHGRSMRLTNGNALIARLARTAFFLRIPIWTDAPARELTMDNGRVTGALIEMTEGPVWVMAKRGVVLACGGFPHSEALRERLMPHVQRGAKHLSPAPESNTGDGITMAESVGAAIEDKLPNAAAWVPVSEVNFAGGTVGHFPHLIDRYKPGVIAVNSGGKRFVNESDSYHDVGVAMIASGEGKSETACWLICDHATIRKYGLGFAKPFPVPLSLYLRSGYVQRARSLRALAQKIGIDAGVFEKTVRDFNVDAANGEDTQFHRGSTAYNRYLGDSEHKPNPCVAPVAKRPFYAVKTYIGDLGTFAGIKTDGHARALDSEGAVIPGLYAAGNDMASMMGGAYPGGGITLGPAMTFGYIAGRDLAEV